MNLKRLLAVSGAALSVFTVSAVAFAATSTVTITGNTAAAENMLGWMFNRDLSTSTSYIFTNAQASIGSGSLFVQPIGANPSDKFIAENFIHTPMVDLDGIAYDFRVGPQGSANQEEQFYMSVYANFGSSDPLKFYDCRYSVVPTLGSKDEFTTVTFDPTQVYPVTTRSTSPFPCPAVPAEMETLSSGSVVRMFSLNVGDTSSNDILLDGYLDNVVVTVNGDSTVYDFEPMLTPVSKDECKNDGWMTFNAPSFKNQGSCVSFLQNQSFQH